MYSPVYLVYDAIYNRSVMTERSMIKEEKFNSKINGNEGADYHPEITPNQISVIINPGLCGFQILPFDNHSFFDKLGKDVFNESITHINFTIHRIFSEKKRIEIGQHFKTPRALLRIFLVAITLVFIVFTFLIESGFPEVRYATLNYVWIPCLIAAVVCVILFLIMISVIFSPPPFFDFRQTRNRAINRKISEYNEAYKGFGYKWGFEPTQEKLTISKF